MDPFSIALGSITICQVASKIIQFGIAYGQSVSGLPEEVKLLVSEITLLNGVFSALCSSLLGGSEETKSGVDAGVLKETIQECEEKLQELYAYLLKQQDSSSRLRKLGRALKWPLREQDTRDWIARMERYKNTFSLALQQEDIVVSKMIAVEVRDIKLAQEADRLKKVRERQSAEFREALSWISSTDPRSSHLAARKLQQRGTGLWFTSSKSFEAWKHQKHSFLWLHGSAGAGKSILSSIVLDRLMEEDRDTGASTKTIYFYFDFKDINKRTATGIYGSLVAQILEAYWGDHLPPDFVEHHNKTPRPAGEEFFKQCLLDLVPRIGRTRVVVDALDECLAESRIDVLQTLLDMTEAGDVSLLITSREEVDIKSALTGLPKLCIDAKVNSQDITLFVKEECERNVKLKRKLKGKTKEEVISAISTKADGMFRWAKCSLDEIARLRNDKAIKQALQNLPPDLNETYERIIEEISEEDKDIAIRIFQWLVCSLRPMSVNEMIEAIAFEIGDTELDPDTFLNDPEDIIEICGSLVSLDIDAGTIGLGHFSVKEFFVARERTKGPHADYYIDTQKTNIELAKLCLTYVCLKPFGAGRCATKEEFGNRCLEWKLLSYAALYWGAHAREHEDDHDMDFLCHVKRLFLETYMDGTFDACEQAYGLLLNTRWKKMNRTFDPFGPPNPPRDVRRLIFACRLGLISTTKYLISKGIGLEGIKSQDPEVLERWLQDKGSGNALNAATESGNVKVVDIILEAGADINSMAGQHYLPMIIAILISRDREDYSMLEFLIGKGADPNIITPDHSWPLKEATNNRDTTATKLCLDAGGDISLRQHDSGNTLFDNAVISSSPEIFELLRQYGGGDFVHPEVAFMNMTSGVHGYALFLAGQSNYFESAQKILLKDGDKIFKDPSFDIIMNQTFIKCASGGFYRFLEQMLVYSGSSFSSFADCLALATSMGRPKTFKALLDAGGTSIDIKHLQDLLVLAYGRGHKEVVQLLFEAGVPPDCVDQHGWSPKLAIEVNSREKSEPGGIPSTKFETLGANPKKPSRWQIRPRLTELEQPGVVFEGTSAYAPPETPMWHIVFDHPIPPTDTPYYFEVTLEEMGSSFAIGLSSVYAHYDVEGPFACSYENEGEVSILTSRWDAKHYRGYPNYGKGSTVGCYVDFPRRLAKFTCDGKLINVVCNNVRGSVYAVLNMTPETRITTNFGERPFMFDPSAALNPTEPDEKEPVVLEFRTDELPDEQHVMWFQPLQQCIG